MLLVLLQSIESFDGELTMKVIEQSWEWFKKPESVIESIELAGRVCYKSEDRIGGGSAAKFVKLILERGHETVIEHVSASVRFITNRGVTHELVRHRLASYSQESTRYVRYGDQVTFIKPVWWSQYSEEQKKHWEMYMQQSEEAYILALKYGDRPEQAREYLPHAVKTEIVVTTNLREWRHIFELRCARTSHPQMVALMRDCLAGFAKEMPIVFEDLLD